MRPGAAQGIGHLARIGPGHGIHARRGLLGQVAAGNGGGQRGLDAARQRGQVARERLAGERRPDGPATLVAEHQHQLHVQLQHGELDAAQHRVVEHVARHAHDEEIAQTLVEDVLGRHARIRTAENDGKGPLSPLQLGPPFGIEARVGLAKGLVALIAGVQAAEGYLPAGRTGGVGHAVTPGSGWQRGGAGPR